jgi:hypothetical protein
MNRTPTNERLAAVLKAGNPVSYIITGRGALINESVHSEGIKIGSALTSFSATWKSGCECPRCEGQRWTVGRVMAECYDCGVLLSVRHRAG